MSETATMRVNGIELAEQQLDRMGRPMIRKIVEAGAAAAERQMTQATENAGHGPPGLSRRATGEMLASIGRNEYRETLGGGSVDVYPQGTDGRGVRNATKAYVLNFGRGKALKGDKFITGREPETEQAVIDAMQAESDRLIAELNNE